MLSVFVIGRLQASKSVKSWMSLLPAPAITRSRRSVNGQPGTNRRQTRNRPSLYDEAARGALVVMWEASDRVCGKRLKALLPILLPALERNGHLKLDEAIRAKILAMSAATIDRLLWTNSDRLKIVGV